MLSLLLLILLLAALIIALQTSRHFARTLSLLALFITLLLSSYIIVQFNTQQPRLQFAEQGSGILSFYHIAVDGLSLLFLPSVLLVFLSMTLIAWHNIRLRPNIFFALLLLQCTSYLGIFLAQNTLLFTLFWLLSIIPSYALLKIWGHGEKHHQVAKNILSLMLFSSTLLLFSNILLAYSSPFQSIQYAFNFHYLNRVNIDFPHEFYAHALFLSLFLAFAIRIPLFPFQYSLIAISQYGTLYSLIFYAGMPVGLYALLRFMPLFPESIAKLQMPLMLWAIVSIVYALLLAWQQSNLRFILSYLAMSYFSIVLLALLSLTPQGIQGGNLQLLNLLLVLSSLLMLLQLIHQRTGSLEIKNLGHLQQRLPLLSLLYFLFTLVLLSLPGSGLFPAQLLMIKGLFSSQLWFAIASLFLLFISTIILFRHYIQSVPGILSLSAQKTKLSPKMDLRVHESILVVALIVLFLVGLYPQSILDIIRQASELWICQIQMNLQ